MSMAKRKAASSKKRPAKGTPGTAARSKTAAGTATAGTARPGLAPAAAGLSTIRNSIDAIDAKIHALINERARFAQLVGISKSASGKAVDYYRPEREAEVLRMALKRNQGPLRDE